MTPSCSNTSWYTQKVTNDFNLHCIFRSPHNLFLQRIYSNSYFRIRFAFQTLNLADHQVDWLAQHLGHKVNIHKEHYRQVSGLIERVQIAKLLMIQDQDLSSKFKGHDLDQIDVEGMCKSVTASALNSVLHANPGHPFRPPFSLWICRL